MAKNITPRCGQLYFDGKRIIPCRKPLGHYGEHGRMIRRIPFGPLLFVSWLAYYFIASRILNLPPWVVLVVFVSAGFALAWKAWRGRQR